MIDLNLYVYVKKLIIVVIVNKLILTYSTWLVHNFLKHKYNALLKRKDVCLMPLNTFVCVCVCVFHIHSPWTFHLSGTVGMSGNSCCAEDVCFLWPITFIVTLAPSLATLSCSNTRSRQSHELTKVRLACQRLDSILKYFCNSPTFRWRERNQNCP